MILVYLAGAWLLGIIAGAVDVVTASGGDDVGLLGAGAYWQDSL